MITIKYQTTSYLSIVGHTFHLIALFFALESAGETAAFLVGTPHGALGVVGQIGKGKLLILGRLKPQQRVFAGFALTLTGRTRIKKTSSKTKEFV